LIADETKHDFLVLGIPTIMVDLLESKVGAI